MLLKPNKYGLKFWVLADVDTYQVSNFETYTSKDEERTYELGMSAWNGKKCHT